MRHLKNIRDLGRYENTVTKKQYNIKKGRCKDRGTDHYFYLYRGHREYIMDADFHSHLYKKVQP